LPARKVSISRRTQSGARGSRSAGVQSTASTVALPAWRPVAAARGSPGLYSRESMKQE
jgi:hypothetical protein